MSKDCKLVDSKTQPGIFKAGRIKGYLLNWGKLTADPHILNMVKGCKIDFDQLPHQRQPPCQHQLSNKETETISAEIKKLVFKGVLLKSSHEEGEFLSTIFLRPKKDGTHRMILNLKKLNKFVAYHHFKMESLKHVISMMRPNCFMASVDLRDAYYSVPIHQDHQKYLKFEWQGQLYQFTCLPNGLACAPRLFTKLLKPAYSTLRKQGFQSIGYIDDSYLQGITKPECENNVQATTKLFDSLGLYVHPDKSILEPSQVLEFLGFVLNSVTMTVTLSHAKAENIKHVCKDLLTRTQPTIREVAVVIGKLVASCPGVAMGPLFYRQLENDKTAALKFHHGNFDESMVLSPTAKSDLQWWVENIENVSKPISQGNPSYTLYTDASLQGWGAVFQGQSSGGHWAPDEAHQHINCLELKAAYLGLQSFCTTLSRTHVRIFLDNTTAVSYINNMGGTHSLECNHIARTIWMWCITRDIWLSAAHLPGKCNTAADKASRIFHDHTEWKLDSNIYVSITQVLGAPSIDLFASRLNFQTKPYIAWHPDPGAFAIDAFSVDWGKHHFYAFPPFNLIDRVLQKVEADQASGILIVPQWTTQPWFPVLMRLLVQEPLILPRGKKVLQLPYNPSAIHPLHHKLTLMACKLSGCLYKVKDFQSKLLTLSCHHGENQQRNSTGHTLRDGISFQLNGLVIPCNRL